MNLTLPPIRIDDLAPKTRDWLLAQAAQLGKSPLAILAETLDAAARRDGFLPISADAADKPAA